MKKKVLLLTTLITLVTATYASAGAGSPDGRCIVERRAPYCQLL